MEWFEEPLKVDDIRPAARRWGGWDRVLVAVLVTVLSAALVFLFLPLLRQRTIMESRLQKLDHQYRLEQQRSRELRREIDALQTDAAYVERVARDKLNLAAPGETLFQFEPPRPTLPVSNRPTISR